ncbi:hypothetical protein TOPH_04720, partial [Tolypocladium ophioglossoides CBS 100239]
MVWWYWVTGVHLELPSARNEDRGEDIALWAEESGLSLLNAIDVPTNPHGNTIDLAFTNVPLATAAVEDHLATSSDHFTISLTLPELCPAPLQPGKVRLTTEEELKRFVELVEAGAEAIPAAASTPEELDALASSLVETLQLAAKAAGRVSRKGARSAPWWNEECVEAAAEYGAIRRTYPFGFNEDIQRARLGFQRVVRRAKRLYWRNLHHKGIPYLPAKGGLVTRVQVGYVTKGDTDQPSDSAADQDDLVENPFTDPDMQQSWDEGIKQHKRYWLIRKAVQQGERRLPSQWGLPVM